jgi:hypothetical protein
MARSEVTPAACSSFTIGTRSAAHQTINVDHIVVADGFAQQWIDDEPVRHIKLDRCYDDYGNTPRGLGALLAISIKESGCWGRGGLARNDDEALRLFKLAAEQGDPLGNNNLGFFYESGRGGLAKDDREAARAPPRRTSRACFVQKLHPARRQGRIGARLQRRRVTKEYRRGRSSL